jgi:hypothetical protein
LHGRAFLAKDILKEGLIWRIEDGRDAKIWQDKWLPTPTTYAIQSLRALLPANATVSVLIDQDSHWWNG